MAGVTNPGARTSTRCHPAARGRPAGARVVSSIVPAKKPSTYTCAEGGPDPNRSAPRGPVALGGRAAGGNGRIVDESAGGGSEGARSGTAAESPDSVAGGFSVSAYGTPATTTAGRPRPRAAVAVRVRAGAGLTPRLVVPLRGAAAAGRPVPRPLAAVVPPVVPPPVWPAFALGAPRPA